MTNEIKLHVGYIGLTRKGKRVEIVDMNEGSSWPYRGNIGNTYKECGSYGLNAEPSDRDIIAPHPDMQSNPDDEYVTRAELAKALADLKEPEGREYWVDPERCICVSSYHAGFIHVREVV